MENLALEVLRTVVPPLMGGAFGLILAHFRSKRALDACLKAKKACNDEVHCLRSEISDLKTAVLVAQARIVGLEAELDKRLRAVEGRDAS